MSQTPKSHEPKEHSPDRPEEKDGGRSDQRRGLDSIATPDIEKERDILKYLQTGFEFEPRKEEKSILNKIESHIKDHLGTWFNEADEIVEEYYSFVKTRRIVSSEEVQYVDDYAKLTGQDVESFIGRLQQIIYNLSMEVSKLHMQAQLSYNIWDDSYWQSYKDSSGNTINDKIAEARYETRESRYIYFFTYYYWKLANSRLEQLIKMRQVWEFQSQRQLKRDSRY